MSDSTTDIHIYNAQRRIRFVLMKYDSNISDAIIELKDRLSVLLKRCKDPWCFGKKELSAIKSEISEIYSFLHKKK